MKFIVAHPEQQHSYHLAVALKKAGMLEKYITTVYKKKYNFTALITIFLPIKYKKKFMSRHCDELNDSDVMQFYELKGIVKIICNYIPFFKRYYLNMRMNLSDRFAYKVVDYAIKHDVDAVITYDNCSPILFQELKNRAPNIIRIIDMSAANFQYMKPIYEKDFELAPAFAARLKKERSYIWDEQYMDRYMKDIVNAHYFLTPSEFVQKSLTYSGIKCEQMLYCPYGVDISMFSPKYKPVQQKGIEFIYVGGVKELKGINYLLECFTKISASDAHLTVVGMITDESVIEKYKDNVTFTGFVQHDEISEFLLKADVFVFPSLGDSFSLSAMEAAACGLPLIITENTGMCDYMTNGKEGFIVPAQSSEALAEKILWFIAHPEKIIEMGQSARIMAEKSSWNTYYNKIPVVISQVLPKTRHKNGGGEVIDRPLIFIYVGGIKELKGVYYLLEAFKQISKEKAYLSIVGNYDNEDEDIAPYLNHVKFTGFVPHREIPSILMQSDVFIFPSLGEGMSLSVLEAAACGLPLIISKNSGIAEKMVDGREGFIIPIQSTEAIVQRVNWFIHHPYELYHMGIAARKMSERYSWEKYNKRILDILSNEVCKKK